MKSAYELAMEKLEKDSPTRQLTIEQKHKISEIDSLYQSKVAEKEVFLQSEIQKAMQNNDRVEVENLQLQLSREMRRLLEEGEKKKETIRKQNTP